MTKAERKSVWETRVAQYRASGQSASAWCAENKVSLCQLYYWLKKNGAQPPVWIPVAYVMSQKYVESIPLYRQEQQMNFPKHGNSLFGAVWHTAFPSDAS